MNVLVAVDAFKGSMTSLEAGTAIKNGIADCQKDWDVTVVPVADGGEGTVEALTYGKKGVKTRNILVTGPIGEPVHASYVLYEKGNSKTAVIEIAEAAGLSLVPEDKKNPLYTTTYGVGEMIKDAMKEGCRQFVIGIGGSATNDGGIGMLQALGYHFVDEKGKETGFGAEGLGKIADIYFEDVISGLSACSFQIACDVENPLVGESGCSRIFAPQKGADSEMIDGMEQSMKRYADLVEHIAMCDMGFIRANGNRKTPGTGAAGGLGYAFLMFLNANLRKGAEIVLEETELEQRIQCADCVITGEGCMDAQTLMGKTPIGVAKLAKRYQKPVLAFAGQFGAGVEQCTNSGYFDACYSITENLNEEEKAHAMETNAAIKNMETCVKRVFSTFSPDGYPNSRKDLLPESIISEMIERALDARKNAYIPYSGFQVGACVRTEDGSLFTGCNIENASYGASNCAERTAIFKAVSEGYRKITAIAVTGGLKDGECDYTYPCGICRQVIAEFAGKDCQIFIAKSRTEYKIHSVEDLLPEAFHL